MTDMQLFDYTWRPHRASAGRKWPGEIQNRRSRHGKRISVTEAL